MNLPSDFKEFLSLLNSKNVDYVIVGGYAVAFHGYPRFTGDIDVLIVPEKENVEKLLDAIAAFGFASLKLDISDFMEPQTVIQLGMPPLRIDMINSIDGIDNQTIFSDIKISDFDGMKIPFISLQNLKKNKASTGRLKDMADLESLGGADNEEN